MTMYAYEADGRSLGEQRLPVVKALRKEGHSFRAIGEALGVSKSQIKRDEQEVSREGHLDAPERSTGQDGKSYPSAVKPRSAPPTGRPGHRNNKKAAYTPDNNAKLARCRPDAKAA